MKGDNRMRNGDRENELRREKKPKDGSGMWMWLALAIAVVALALGLQNSRIIEEMRQAEVVSLPAGEFSTVEEFSQDVSERIEIAIGSMDAQLSDEEVGLQINQLREELRVRYINLTGDLNQEWQNLDVNLEEIAASAGEGGSNAIEALQNLLESWQDRLQ